MTSTDVIGIVSAIAIFVGPIVAVVITRKMDSARDLKDRRMDVFRALMRTRKLRLHPDHVGALNLVEIEFFDEPEAIEAWKNYWECLNKKVAQDKPEELNAHNTEQGKLLTILLHRMANSLGFKIEQLEILDGGYAPQGWVDIELQAHALRQLLIELLRGQRGLPVTPLVVPSPGVPYPPKPDGNQSDTSADADSKSVPSKL